MNNRVLASLSLSLTALTASAAWAAPAAAAPASTDEQLNARVERSVVQLEINWAGYVHYETATGYVWTDEPVETVNVCSGFFVSTAGHVATAGHCADPAGGRESIIDEFLRQQVTEGLITTAEADAITPGAYANWRVEGTAQGSQPVRTVYVRQPVGVQGVAVREPAVAQVVDFRPFDQGDMALLRLEGMATTPLAIAHADPASGAALTAVGFPATVTSNVDATRVRASFKTGTVSSQQISETGVAQIEVNADLSGGMSGGPTVNAAGEVVGVNSAKLDGDGQNFNVITDTTDLRDWLTAHSVPLATNLQPAGSAGSPRAADDGTAWSDGARWLLLAVIILAMLVITVGIAYALGRRQRSRTAPRPTGTDAMTTCPACGERHFPGSAFCATRDLELTLQQ